MDEQTLSISLSNATSIDDPYWLHMELKEDSVEDGMTVNEAAELIDSAYNIKACESEESQDIWAQGELSGYDIWNPVEDKTGVDAETMEAQQRFADSLANLDVMNSCAAAGTSAAELLPYDATIKIFRSHHDELYKLQMVNGTASSPVRVEERVIHHLDVQDQTSITLDNPIISYRPVKTPVIKWMGVDGPEIHIKGNTLYWDTPMTGTLRAEFDTEWDEVTVHVTGDLSDSTMITGTTPPDYMGTGFYSGTENGEEIDDYQDIECSVLAFYHYQYQEIVLHRPEEDESTTVGEKLNFCHFVTSMVDSDSSGTGGETTTGDDDTPQPLCKQHVLEEVVCRCKGRNETHDYYEMVPCPAGVPAGSTLRDGLERRTYKDCGYRDKYNNPVFYAAVCCEPPSEVDVNLPLCREQRLPYTGDSEGVDKSSYPKDTTFITVSPAGGMCGEHLIEQVLKPKSCCDEVPEMTWDYANSDDSFGSGATAVVAVTPGSGTYHWKVRGTDFAFSNGLTEIVTSSLDVRIYEGPNACGSAYVFVDDGCVMVSGVVRSSNGRWEWIDTIRPPCLVDKSKYNLFEQEFTSPAVASGYVSTVKNGYWYGPTDASLGEIGRPILAGRGANICGLWVSCSQDKNVFISPFDDASVQVPAMVMKPAAQVDCGAQAGFGAWNIAVLDLARWVC